MTKKELSKQHEEYIAKKYSGQRSRSSGASDTDKGDVRVEGSSSLIECKLTGSPGNEPKRSTLLAHMEKVADEAWAEGKEPAVALRLFCPTSPVANVDGWVDMTVRLTVDDARREAAWLSS